MAFFSHVCIEVTSDEKLYAKSVFKINSKFYYLNSNPIYYLLFTVYYLSISGMIKSIVAIIEIKSPILCPLAMCGIADRFAKLGERYLQR